METSEQVKYQ
jgi:hypothetical protein